MKDSERNLTHSKPLFIRGDDEFEEALEALRRLEEKIPSKAAMVRQVVIDAWKAAKAKKRK